MNPLNLLSPVASLLFGGNKQPKPTLQPRVDQSARDAAQRDQISRRIGAGANQLTGKLGAESRAGKTKLGL